MEQRIESHILNYPEPSTRLPPYHGLLIVAGSNDPLPERTVSLFNTLYPDHTAVFGNIGSMGGLRELRQERCHIASSYLLQENEEEYNFDFAEQELEKMPAVINFCLREQGIPVQKQNPLDIRSVADLARPGVRIVNRGPGTGTRLLLDRELRKAGIATEAIEGYHHEMPRHLDVGIEIPAGRADAGPGIRSVSSLLGPDFVPLHWERYDLLVTKERFFDPGVQLFLGMLHEKSFNDLAGTFEGCDIRLSGKIILPKK